MFLGCNTAGKTVCTGSADAALRVWNPKSGECLHIIQGANRYHQLWNTCTEYSSKMHARIT